LELSELFLTPRISRLIVSPISRFLAHLWAPLIIADIILQDLESTALEVLTCNIFIYNRYIDDILIATPKSHWNYILNIFNSQKNPITLELNNNEILNFLDVKIIIKDHRILFDCYRKSTCSGRYLNFYSQHPTSQKRAL